MKQYTNQAKARKNTLRRRTARKFKEIVSHFDPTPITIEETEYLSRYSTLTCEMGY